MCALRTIRARGNLRLSNKTDTVEHWDNLPLGWILIKMFKDCHCEDSQFIILYSKQARIDKSLPCKQTLKNNNL